MSSRRDTLEKLESKIESWNARLNRLATAARGARADAGADVEAQLQELRKLRDDTERRLRQARAAGEDAWTELKRGLEDSWTRTERALESAATRLRA